MPGSSVDAVGPAFQRMKQCLFAPFRLSQWIRFAIVGFLAGEMGSGGGVGGQFPSGIPTPQTGGFPGSVPPLGMSLTILILALGFAALIAITLVILFIYISSRMRFVLFDS